MALYGISDLHLSFGVDKPMNIFGKVWDNYEEKVKVNWKKKVKDDDFVIIAGDISWGMHLVESIKDFEFIHSLPGKKIILKGNHDYYFASKTKMEKFFKDNHMDEFYVLQTNAIDIGDYIICGTRGWGEVEGEKELDEKIIKREAIRLRLSLDEAVKLRGENVGKKIVLAMHFPPFLKEFQDVINEYDVYKCVYGHLHGYGHTKVKEGKIGNVTYVMIGCDYTGFEVTRL
ncbi:MAG: metallophosphoesterase [Clostridia bacterium]|nr:metallophosphoesterase [Clostridia bacterium]